jgi:hypothetical protein
MGINFVAGTQNAIVAPHNNAFDLFGNWALSVWVKGDATSWNGYMTLLWAHYTAGYSGFQSGFQSGGNRTVNYNLGGGNAYTFNLTSANAPTIGDNSGKYRHLLQIAVSPTTMEAYVDGEFAQSTNIGSTAMDAVNASVYMGDWSAINPGNGYPSRTMHGCLDDFRVYSNTSYDPAWFAKALFESRGNDNLTDGLVWRPNFKGGTKGNVPTVIADLSLSQTDVNSIINTPTWDDSPINN